MNVWTEHRNPEGRTYWFNTQSRESVWEKPDDLKTPFEKALTQTKWKEYFSGGRKYYYNTESKESKWDMPDELVLLLEKVDKDGKTNASPTPPAQPNLITGSAPASGFTPIPAQNALATTNGLSGNPLDPSPAQAAALPIHTTTSGALPARPNLPEDPVIPHNGFATLEEGEKAFVHLLRKAGVDAGWSWDQTMRTIITDPLYKALNTLAEKKACWQKYVDGLKAREQEEREARLAKLRPALRNMLKGNPHVFHYSTFATADKLFAQHPIWQQAKIEAERKLIFEEYVTELKQREMQEQRAARSRAISTVVALFKQMDVDVLTRWRQAHAQLLASEEWAANPDLNDLPALDVLLAFEDYSRVREREFEEGMRRQQVEKTRRERKAREGFKQLLGELIANGTIKARTKWKTIYPAVKDDERYHAILGNPGSNPLELFWDTVDGLDQALDAKIAVLDEALGGEAEVTAETDEEQWIQDAKGKTELTAEELKGIFYTKVEEARKKQDEERRKLERKQRHMQDDLRYALKKLSEPIDMNMSYEDAVPLMENLPEFKALEDEGRRSAFTKFVKRQKERMREASEDGASTTSRKRKEPHREKDEYRDRDHRDRGHRYGHDDHDTHRSGRERDYGYQREYRDREYSGGGYARGSKHKYDRDYDRDDRRKDRRRDWEEAPYARAAERERSASVGIREGSRKLDDRDEKAEERGGDKRARYERSSPVPESNGQPPREDTPEEGEI